MPQHIRNQQQHVRTQQPTATEKATAWVNKTFDTNYSRISTKQAMGTILTIFLMIILVVLALHYFRIITLPLPVPQKAAPASHLQYFFF
jgi:hypothetical protein